MMAAKRRKENSEKLESSNFERGAEVLDFGLSPLDALFMNLEPFCGS
jgi:hypothetical protein